MIETHGMPHARTSKQVFDNRASGSSHDQSVRAFPQPQLVEHITRNHTSAGITVVEIRGNHAIICMSHVGLQHSIVA